MPKQIVIPEILYRQGRKKISLLECLFFCGMTLSCVYMAIYIAVYNIPFSTVFAVLIFGFYFATILMSKQTKKEIIMFALISLLGIGCALVTHDTLIFRIIFMIFAAREINKKKLVDFITKTYWLMIIIVPLTCTFRGIDSVYSDFIPGVGRDLGRRFMFGFDGPNRLGVVWICLMSMILIKRGKRDSKKDVCLVLITVLLYYLTKSRSLIITAVFILAFPYFVWLIGRLRSWFLNKKFILLLLILLVGITFYFGRNATDRNSAINILLNNRLVHFQDVVNNESFTLFGSTSDFSVYVGLDNSYFLNFYKRGIVFSALYLIAVIRLAIVLGKKREIMQISVLCGFIILAFVQDIIQHPYINIIYFLIMINYFDYFGVKCKNYNRGVKLYDTENNTLLLVRQ